MHLHEFVMLVAKESTRFDVDHFMWIVHFLTTYIWHYKLIFRLAVVFGFLPVTLLLNKFSHPCYTANVVFRIVQNYDE